MEYADGADPAGVLPEFDRTRQSVRGVVVGVLSYLGKVCYSFVEFRPQVFPALREKCKVLDLVAVVENSFILVFSKFLLKTTTL